MIIGIIADDLTGAADSVAPFAVKGYCSVVDFVVGSRRAPCVPDAEARAWTTSNRDQASRTDAGRRNSVRAAARRAQMLGARMLYHKIDSTLRGHIRQDMDALRAEAPGRIAVVCPAFPANGRLVVNGILLVNGEARESVRAAFGMRDDLQAIELSLEILRQESDRLPRRLLEWRARGIHSAFCDAETGADLAILARAVLESADSVLPVGSAGLSGAIADQLPEGNAAPIPGMSVRDSLHTGRVLVAVGSMNPASRRQARWLAERAGAEPVVFTPHGLTEPVVARILGIFEAGQRIVLMQSPDGHMEEQDSLVVPRPPLTMRLRMAVPDLGFVITGGETAAAMLSTLTGCTAIDIEGELAAGVVTGRLRGTGGLGGRIEGLPILLKAGGFGDEDLLARCVGL